MAAELNTEQKQRINLSQHAQDVLNNDWNQFAPNLSKSGFINELLYRYAPQAQASITETVKRQRQMLLIQLEKMRIGREKVSQEILDAVTQNLLDPFQSEIIRKSKTYPRGTSLTFRLNNRNRDYFYDPAWQDAKYYDDKPSRYMKALIEEYASHTLFMREAFYFQESITLTKAAEASGQLLRITMQNAKEEKAEWDIRVYGVLPNDAGLFHYIIGRSVTKGGLKSEERIASFRVSRIQNMRILSASGTRSGRLSKAEKKEIEDKIARDGVQFLVGEREECIVKLTEKGKQMYRQIQYMKPNASFIDEEGYYHFECSAYQIFLYFYRFGEHAKVLKPASLREIFADEYRRAWEAYCHIERPEELSNR